MACSYRAMPSCVIWCVDGIACSFSGERDMEEFEVSGVSGRSVGTVAGPGCASCWPIGGVEVRRRKGLISILGGIFSAMGGRPLFFAGLGISCDPGAKVAGEATVDGLPVFKESSPFSSVGVRGARGVRVCGNTGRNCLDWSALDGLPLLRVPGGSCAELAAGGPMGVEAPAWPRAGSFGCIFTCCVSSLGKGRGPGANFACIGW